MYQIGNTVDYSINNFTGAGVIQKILRNGIYVIESIDGDIPNKVYRSNFFICSKKHLF